MPYLGAEPDFSDVVSGASSTADTLLQRLHQVAVQIAAARARGDVAAVSALRGQFTEIAEQIRAQGATDMTAIDRAILAIGNYVSGVVDALPGALSALPRAAAGAITQTLVSLVVPAALILGAVMLFGRAQRSARR